MDLGFKGRGMYPKRYKAPQYALREGDLGALTQLTPESVGTHREQNHRKNS